MTYELCEHRCGLRVVPEVDRLNVQAAIDDLDVGFGYVETNKIQGGILDYLQRLGWSNSVKVANGTNITITSMHNQVGLAIQLGNVSRIYADMLKLQSLYLDEKISSGIIIVPHYDYLPNLSKKGGMDNRINHARLFRELPVFSKVITIPLVVYGVKA